MERLGLGEALQLRGWISRRQLEQALVLQRRRGGKIGTCLLELRAISEEQLLAILAERGGVPPAPLETLRNLSSHLAATIPGEVAARLRAIPLGSSNGVVEFALEEPRDLEAVDELAFASGRRVRPFALHEARLHQGLEQLYGIECPSRFAQLLLQLDRDRHLGPPEPPAPATPYLPTPPAANRPAPPLPRAAEGRAATRSAPPKVLEVSDEERSQLFAPSESAEGAPVEQRLRRAVRASEIGEALVDHLGPRFGRVALLRPARGGFEGWMGRGEGFDEERLRCFHSGGAASLFLHLELGSGDYHGPLRKQEKNAELLACWRRGSWPAACALVPLRLGSKIVCVIYVDGPRGEAATDLEALRSLADLAAKAFENCILRNRLRSRGQ